MSGTTAENNQTTWRIHGNIGSGKSSLIDALSRLEAEDKFLTAGKHVVVHPERIDKWSLWLERYYKNPVQEAPRLQMCIVGHYLDVTRKILEYDAQDERETVHVVERGPCGVRDIFLPLNAESEAIQYFYPMIHAMFFDTELGARDLPWHNARNIYLRASPELCLERIKARGRSSECFETDDDCRITLERLRELHQRHDDVYLGRSDVLVIDVSEGAQASPEILARRLWQAVQLDECVTPS